MFRLFLLLLGLLTLAGLIWHIGPTRIFETTAGLGPAALVVILLPSLLMYSVEAWGWRLTLGPSAGAVSFWRLAMIRTAGEVVNWTTPMAYVGGEPLKAYLLSRHGVPLVEGLASVITAKTTMTLAQVVFILLGVALGVWTIQTSGSAEPSESLHVQVAAASVSVGLLLFVMVIFMAVQRRGLFTGLLSLLRCCRIRVGFLESREDKLRTLDRMIGEFYTRDQRVFFLSMGMFFLGWLIEALEVFLILSYLNPPADVFTSISIGALAVLIKGGTFFIPGSVGAQEAGNLVLLAAYGYSDVVGITFSMLRRLRELVWIGIGLLCMAALGGFKAPISTAELKGSPE